MTCAPVIGLREDGEPSRDRMGVATDRKTTRQRETAASAARCRRRLFRGGGSGAGGGFVAMSPLTWASRSGHASAASMRASSQPLIPNLPTFLLLA